MRDARLGCHWVGLCHRLGCKRLASRHDLTRLDSTRVGLACLAILLLTLRCLKTHRTASPRTPNAERRCRPSSEREWARAYVKRCHEKWNLDESLCPSSDKRPQRMQASERSCNASCSKGQGKEKGKRASECGSDEKHREGNALTCIARLDSQVLDSPLTLRRTEIAHVRAFRATPRCDVMRAPRAVRLARVAASPSRAQPCPASGPFPVYPNYFFFHISFILFCQFHSNASTLHRARSLLLTRVVAAQSIV